MHKVCMFLYMFVHVSAYTWGKLNPQISDLTAMALTKSSCSNFLLKFVQVSPHRDTRRFLFNFSLDFSLLLIITFWERCYSYITIRFLWEVPNWILIMLFHWFCCDLQFVKSFFFFCFKHKAAWDLQKGQIPSRQHFWWSTLYLGGRLYHGSSEQQLI